MNTGTIQRKQEERRFPKLAKIAATAVAAWAGYFGSSELFYSCAPMPLAFTEYTIIR